MFVCLVFFLVFLLFFDFLINKTIAPSSTISFFHYGQCNIDATNIKNWHLGNFGLWMSWEMSKHCLEMWTLMLHMLIFVIVMLPLCRWLYVKRRSRGHDVRRHMAPSWRYWKRSVAAISSKIDQKVWNYLNIALNMTFNITHYLISLTQCCIYLLYTWYFTTNVNWLFGHCRILTTLLCEQLHQQWKDAVLCISK